jgi:hypothetical protein
VTANISELIYDWNTIYARSMIPAGRVLLNDESLRDGLQSPSVRDPSIEEKIEILHLMEGVGINMLDIGLPGAGPRAQAHCEALAREIGRSRMKIKPNCAARTHQNDIRPVAEIVERTGVPIEGQHSSDRARSAAIPKTGPMISCSAPRKMPSSMPCRSVLTSCM